MFLLFVASFFDFCDTWELAVSSKLVLFFVFRYEEVVVSTYANLVLKKKPSHP